MRCLALLCNIMLLLPIPVYGVGRERLRLYAYLGGTWIFAAFACVGCGVG